MTQNITGLHYKAKIRNQYNQALTLLTTAFKVYYFNFILSNVMILITFHIKVNAMEWTVCICQTLVNHGIFDGFNLKPYL